MIEMASKRKIDKIGEIVRDGEPRAEYEEACRQMNIWRKMHGAPMDLYYDKCCELIANYGKNEDIFVAQRLKRFPTIVDKLRRPNLDMRLSVMQDIAGVRIVLDDIEKVEEAEKEILRWEGLKREPKDYIRKPRSSGYRGKHFVFEKDKMFVEIQLRTKLQHIWATSLETIDAFLGTAMKTGAKTNREWQEFFKITSSVFARIEGCPTIAEHKDLSLTELCRELTEKIELYGIDKKMKNYNMTKWLGNTFVGIKKYYAVMSLNEEANGVTVSYFMEDQYEDAVEMYENLEKFSKKNNNILVSVDDLKKIREAYPNYFLDLKKLMEIIKAVIEINKELK